MSGGVDSSVAAYLMKKRGFDCIGVTMKLFDNDDIGEKRAKTCCSLDDVEDARSVAQKLGMPYYVFNFKDDFRQKVIGRFIDAYENGRTPNPCIDCNRYLKFEKLYHRAKELGFDYVATGHYARIEEQNGRFLLKKAVDETKDQSYVLYSLTQEQLKHTLFPLGDNDKTETRRIAAEQVFFNSDKPDSQDICFVPDGDYKKFIRSFTGKEYPSGNFVGVDGEILGKHSGIIGYTVGQRKGLNVSFGKPMYVCGICPENNTVILSGKDKLYADELTAGNFNFISFENPPETFRANVKIRYRQKEKPATVTVLDEKTVKIKFDEPQRAVTKGQAAVLYDGDTVIGGGEIL